MKTILLFAIATISLFAQAPAPALTEIPKETALSFENLALAEKLARTQAELANAQAALAVMNSQLKQQSLHAETCKSVNIPTSDCIVFPQTDPQSGERKWYVKRADPTPKPEPEPKKEK